MRILSLLGSVNENTFFIENCENSSVSKDVEKFLS